MGGLEGEELERWWVDGRAGRGGLEGGGRKMTHASDSLISAAERASSG